MKVRLTKKLADRLNGIDVSASTVGDELDLPPEKANLLVAEGWAIRERRSHSIRTSVLRRASDRPSRTLPAKPTP